MMLGGIAVAINPPIWRVFCWFYKYDEIQKLYFRFGQHACSD